MGNSTVQLPYFDILIRQLQENNDLFEETFGRHVHWGYWPDPTLADGSVADFAIAAEALCQRVYGAAQIQPGQAIADVGCGFGGTIASLNETFASMQFTGINIDGRQLERARQTVLPQKDNRITFIEGDACDLPLTDQSQDVVLAVECIFHFPSREHFFQEARRVLRPGGRLSLSDFVPIPLWRSLQTIFAPMLTGNRLGTYGQVNTGFTLKDYRQLAEKTGFKLITQEDITPQTLPTYPLVKSVFNQSGDRQAVKDTAAAEWVSRRGLLRYQILGFQRLE